MDKINVFLDDYRTCPVDYFLVETIDDCLLMMKDNEINQLSLDHDLENKYRNGFMLVEMMVAKQLFAESITIHSANVGAGKAMYKYLKSAQDEWKMPLNIIIKLRPLPLR
ncbi:hypothetical protein CR203_13770 [Salipaludibacillus neizhouensis]|uniref:Cyclic-phosphate processing Receiver domain-containing protein n=1 Tax=Salipaludibacillus neizhouensis TaxID=885475 RepID=A0A3A9K8P6_9BACI|nr:cyclic-phosphate processing receiver domain-containing protein [Salipaludibacillus neizhouensis]RKL66892.1 hypothetical protein CR203_13770 [Salipaludibacillus neizhouensis]